MRSAQAARENLNFYLWISPWIIGFLAFQLGPMLYSLYLSFTHYPPLGSPQWVGLAQYHKMLGDPLFWQSLKVTLYFTLLNVPVSLVGGLVVALLLNRTVPGIKLLRTVYFLPRAMTGVGVAYLWVYIFNPQFGLINRFLLDFGIHGPMWLFSRAWVIPAFVLMDLWAAGGGMVIWLGALQDVPTSLYEASSLDGAGTFTQFFRITLPMVSPILLFNLVMAIIHSFEVFSSVYVMTSGGPGTSSLFYVLYLFDEAFQSFHFGYASALAWVLFVIILGLTLLVFKFSKTWVYYETDVEGRR